MSEARTLPEPSPLARPLLESPSPARALLESHFFRAPLRRAPPFWREGQGDSTRLPRKGSAPQGDSAKARAQKGGLGAGRGLTRPARTTARPEKGLVAGRDQPTRLA